MPRAKSRTSASRTRGRGKKKGRGAGLRGGRGNAGLHKHRYLQVIKYAPDHFGRHGFKRPQSTVQAARTLNIDELAERLPDWQKEGLATTSDDLTTLDLGAMGYDKLLGRGELAQALQIKVPQASAKALERVAAAGGEVTLGA